MTTIDITTTPTDEGWSCDVTLRDGDETHHRVRVSRSDLTRLARGGADPELPDYEREIARRMREDPPD